MVLIHFFILTTTGVLEIR